MIYITSDFHFNHNKEFIYIPRGFNDVQSMNNAIIQNFNKIVKSDDDVYILGDLMLGGADKQEEGLELISSLNGKLHIVRGNHDSDKRWAAFQELHNVVEAQNAIYLNYRKYHFYMSHYPSMTANYSDDKKGLKSSTINLCGHSHTANKWQDWRTGSYHCELEAHNNKPILLDDIIKEMEEHHLFYQEEERIIPRCDKCVHTWPDCGDTDFLGRCNKYKRDPPDGGFYG